MPTVLRGRLGLTFTSLLASSSPRPSKRHVKRSPGPNVHGGHMARRARCARPSGSATSRSSTRRCRRPGSSSSASTAAHTRSGEAKEPSCNSF